MLFYPTYVFIYVLVYLSKSLLNWILENQLQLFQRPRGQVGGKLQLADDLSLLSSPGNVGQVAVSDLCPNPAPSQADFTWWWLYSSYSLVLVLIWANPGLFWDLFLSLWHWQIMVIMMMIVTRKRRKKKYFLFYYFVYIKSPAPGGDLNPWPIDQVRCALPLCYNHCP